MRNEMLRLPYFLDYHRNLGVQEFIFIDNNSDDESQAYLSSQEDVVLYSTSQSYSASNCGVDWLNHALDKHGVGRWALILDADELLVYPKYENRDLHHLVKYIELEGANALVAPMIDMYPRGPIRSTNYKQGENVLSTACYFDSNGYERNEVVTGFPTIARGGARDRVFWQGKDRPWPSPYLHKTPLVKWDSQTKLKASTHIVDHIRPSRLTAALLHFKMLQDFPVNAAQEEARKEHFAGARQYSAYADTFRENPDLSAFFEGSIMFENSDQLVRLGFMQEPEDY